MEEKGQIFLGEFQLIDMEGVRKIKNHHEDLKNLRKHEIYA